jgi:hypothetical protein
MKMQSFEWYVGLSFVIIGLACVCLNWYEHDEYGTCLSFILCLYGFHLWNHADYKRLSEKIGGKE